MSAAIIATLVVQIILSLILVVVVLFQSGNQQGLSGSIAGGAETFFGKNKGRTIDAKLKKWTSIIAILFLICSIALSFMVSNQQAANEATDIPVDMSAVSGETAPVEVVPADGETAPVEDVPEDVEPITAE